MPNILAIAAMMAALEPLHPVDVFEYRGDERVGEVYCLAANIYFEARNQHFGGKLAVGHVVKNRQKSNKFPGGDYCDVISQKGAFSWTEGLKRRQARAKKQGRNLAKTSKIDHESWKSSIEAALVIDANLSADNTGQSVYYCNPELASPTARWCHALTPKGKRVGDHIFISHRLMSRWNASLK